MSRRPHASLRRRSARMDQQLADFPVVRNPGGSLRLIRDESNMDGHIALLREESQSQNNVVGAAINDNSAMHHDVLAGMGCEQRSLEAQKRLVFVLPFAVGPAAIQSGPATPLRSATFMRELEQHPSAARLRFPPGGQNQHTYAASHESPAENRR